MTDQKPGIMVQISKPSSEEIQEEILKQVFDDAVSRMTVQEIEEANLRTREIMEESMLGAEGTPAPEPQEEVKTIVSCGVCGNIHAQPRCEPLEEQIAALKAEVERLKAVIASLRCDECGGTRLTTREKP